LRFLEKFCLFGTICRILSQLPETPAFAALFFH
jgi:hypothetical protein